MLVDNAVVVIENTFRHLEEGKDVKSSAQLGGTEVQMAITSSTLTTVAVFLPMVLASGLSGKLARPLALTVVVALFSSLFVALTLVPMISTLILKNRKGISERRKKQRAICPFQRLVSSHFAMGLNAPKACPGHCRRIIYREPPDYRVCDRGGIYAVARRSYDFCDDVYAGWHIIRGNGSHYQTD